MTESAKNTATLSGTPQLVHETEAQRQHIRISLPASIHIDGKNYTLADWSVGGISVILNKGAIENFRFKLRMDSLSH